MSRIYAICRTLDAGYPGERENLQKSGIKVGDKIELVDVSMGQSYTSVLLDGYEHGFNSVFFNFVDENGRDYNIFRDPRFNPYL